MATKIEPLPQAWGRRSAAAGALSTVDHKTIGVRYMITAFMFFCMAGTEALFIRAQLSRAENTFLSPDIYNQFFTMHGVTMIFFFALPVLFGLGNFLIPLMIGARNMAFPRLNAFGYWTFLFSGLFLYSSVLFGAVPYSGWLADTFLSNPQYMSGLNLDFWSLGLIFLSVALIVGAVNFFVTILKKRAPGMLVERMPLFAWAILVASFAMIFAAVLLAAANVVLMLDRRGAGGNPLLWQHLFQGLSHPELYLIFLPAAGIVYEVIGTFSRRPILGYIMQVISIVAVGVIGVGLSIAMIFAPGISPFAVNIITFLIYIPIWVLIFTWLIALLTGRPVWKTPLMWIGGFLFLFVAGSLAGLVILAAPANPPATGSLFDVAYLHAMLAGGAVFPIFAGFYYWFPKIFGRMLGERLGKINFWLFFIGSILAFSPMYILGLEGMPRRIYAYRPGFGWDGLNLLATIGAIMIAEGVLVFIVNMITSIARGRIAGDNPWDGGTLEWAAASPPEPGNFQRIPVVLSRVPLWTAGSERLGTTALDTQPSGTGRLLGNSLKPFLLAAALVVVFVGLLISLYWLAGAGMVLAAGIIIFWLLSSRME